jgi:hypothetical protein
VIFCVTGARFRHLPRSLNFTTAPFIASNLGLRLPMHRLRKSVHFRNWQLELGCGLLTFSFTLGTARHNTSQLPKGDYRMYSTIRKFFGTHTASATARSVKATVAHACKKKLQITECFPMNSVGHETKSFERCKAILMSRVFGGFRVSSEYLAKVSDVACVGLDGQYCKTRFLRPTVGSN